MGRQSITDLKELFEADQLNEDKINELKSDERKGVQELIKRYELKKQKEQELEDNFIRMSRYEQQLYANGNHYIAGVDEAGRGPLAGPVVAAAVMLPRDFKLIGLNDSKQLNEATRNAYFEVIKQEALSYGVSVVSNQKIDQLNIYEATKLAMYDCVKQLNPAPDHVLTDAVTLNMACPSEAIIKGDQESISIAAASILAKVTRDNIMKEIHNTYPLYGFASNMGYGTKQHMTMLSQHGISPYHRKTFAPVRHAASQ